MNTTQKYTTFLPMPGSQTYLSKKGKRNMRLCQLELTKVQHPPERRLEKKNPTMPECGGVSGVCHAACLPVTKNPEFKGMNSSLACHSRALWPWAKCLKRILIHISALEGLRLVNITVQLTAREQLWAVLC